MKIIILGSAGFIGSNLCHWLINNTEHNVIGVDNLSTGFEYNHPINKRFEFIKADICDNNFINSIFVENKPNACYLFAAYAAEGRSNYIRSFIHQNNTVGTSNVINNCINHNCKLIFTSSVAVYSGEPPYNEETTANPIDEYGLSKWTSERSIQIAGETQGLDWCIIRPRNVYGERQSLWDTARNLFGIWCHQALNKVPLTIYGDGSNTRSFTYIKDILAPLYKAIDYDKQIFNLGSEKVYSIKQVQEIFSEITGYKNVANLEARHEVKNAFCLTEKSKQLLGFKDETSIYDGLIRMWAYARNAPNIELQVPPTLEITKNLHSSIR